MPQPDQSVRVVCPNPYHPMGGGSVCKLCKSAHEAGTILATLADPEMAALIALGEAVAERLPRGTTAKEAAEMIWHAVADQKLTNVMGFLTRAAPPPPEPRTDGGEG